MTVSQNSSVCGFDLSAPCGGVSLRPQLGCVFLGVIRGNVAKIHDAEETLSTTNFNRLVEAVSSGVVLDHATLIVNDVPICNDQVSIVCLDMPFRVRPITTHYNCVELIRILVVRISHFSRAYLRSRL